ncbi:MAG: hypothetical protein ABIP94_09210 [Planctomycetota bacterium]
MGVPRRNRPEVDERESSCIACSQPGGRGTNYKLQLQRGAARSHSLPEAGAGRRLGMRVDGHGYWMAQASLQARWSDVSGRRSCAPAPTNRRTFPVRTLLTSLSLPVILLLSSCSSVDADRNQMKASISNADRLASEISTWRASLSPDVGASVIDTIEAFKARASDTRSTLGSLSAGGAAGTDLTGVNQALRTVADFDTSTFNGASPTARAALLDQFDGLARNLRRSVERTRERA